MTRAPRVSGLAPEQIQRCRRIQRLARPLDQAFLAHVLVDLAWGSSSLDGASYSALDTQALVEYGQTNPHHPTADAALILAHRNAMQWLWFHRVLSVETVRILHELLTGMPATQGRDAVLEPIVDRANAMPPLDAAFDLLTRLPGLQVFASGNGRTSRLAANAALLQGGWLPMSFARVPRDQYQQGLTAFRDLGVAEPFNQVVMAGYVRAIVMGSQVPVSMRGPEFQTELVIAQLTAFVVDGLDPSLPSARLFTHPAPGTL